MKMSQAGGVDDPAGNAKKKLPKVASYFRRSLGYFQEIEQQHKSYGATTLPKTPQNYIKEPQLPWAGLRIVIPPNESNINASDLNLEGGECQQSIGVLNNVDASTNKPTEEGMIEIVTSDGAHDESLCPNLAPTPSSAMRKNSNGLKTSKIVSFHLENSSSEVKQPGELTLKQLPSFLLRSTSDEFERISEQLDRGPNSSMIAYNFKSSGPDSSSLDSADMHTRSDSSNRKQSIVSDSTYESEERAHDTVLRSKSVSNSKSQSSALGRPKLESHRTSSTFGDIPLYMVSYDTYESVSSIRRKQNKLRKLHKPRHTNSQTFVKGEKKDLPSCSSSSISFKTIASPRNSSVSPRVNLAYRGVFDKKSSQADISQPVKLRSMAIPTSPSTRRELFEVDGPSKRFTYEYDYVMVFPIIATQEQGQSTDAKFIMHTMLRAGLELYPYLSNQSDALFVLIRCPVDVLKNFAERTNFKLLTNPKIVEEILSKGNPDKRIAPIKIKHEPNITPIDPYEYVYLRYQQDNNSALYANAPQEDHSFGKPIRLKLIHTLMTAPKRLGGCNLEINSLVHQRKLLSMFPLHDPDDCHEILLKCLDWKTMPWTTPNEELKEYLGEKISLFNAFLGHISWWLLPISVIGTVCQIIVLITNNFSHPVLPIYSVLIIVWSIFMLANWKREESFIALKWGMIDFVDQQFERPEFYGELHTNSFIDGREMLYFSRKDFRKRVARSLVTILTMVFLVLGVISAIYVLKFSLKSNLGWMVSAIASLLNVSQIMLFNLVYQNMAIRLTDQENHRTDTEYENALILKVFVFQFINSYASLFFLAFVAQQLPRPNTLSDSGKEASYVGQCGDSTCMRPLAINLGVIIASRTFVKNIMDVLIPYMKCLHAFYQFTGGSLSSIHLSPPEMEYILMEYDPILESVRKYADIAVQFGYTVLFAAALPLAPFLTLAYHYVKVKFQAWKLLTLHKRPIPGGAQGIESWQLIFTIISVVAVVTNAGIISFTMTSTEIFPANVRVWIFVCFQWLMLLVQYLTTIMIPESSEYANIQIARINAISQKVIDKFEDDDYDKFAYEYTSEDEAPAAATIPFNAIRERECNEAVKVTNSSAHSIARIQNTDDDGSSGIDSDVERGEQIPSGSDVSFGSVGEVDLENQFSTVGEISVSEHPNRRTSFDTNSSVSGGTGVGTAAGSAASAAATLKRSENFYEQPNNHKKSWWWQRKSNSAQEISFLPSSYSGKSATTSSNNDPQTTVTRNHERIDNTRDTSNGHVFGNKHNEHNTSVHSNSSRQNLLTSTSKFISKKALQKKKKKKKLYRTRVLNPTSDALQLTPLAIFEYPQSELVYTWNAPLTKDRVGEESQMDILQLDI